MFNPFQKLEIIEAETFSTMPGKFRKMSNTDWSDANRQGAQVDNFLEGPSFDRAGNLYVVDIPFGRIFRISPKGEWELVVQYDGWPNGLKLHKDGRAFIADYKCGLITLDLANGRLTTILETAYTESFKGLNDLHFASNGDLYFTDQGQTGIGDPTGRVFRLRAGGALEKLVSNVPSPNGITLNSKENQVFVGVTRSQSVWKLPLMAHGEPSKTAVCIQLSGGHAGPDGIEMDAVDGIYVCHPGVGVWRFNRDMLPTHLVIAKGEHHTFTNFAFGGADLKTMYITDSGTGEVMRAQVPVAGKRLYGLS